MLHLHLNDPTIVASSIRTKVSRRDEDRPKTQKMQYNAKLRGTREFRVGDLVIIWDPTEGRPNFALR